ncbi:CHAP domain-containing protein [Nonomuraea helvata]|uniref:CHAP domain-containing protein n=1 Tax=Nonomuraea helvata TaxID=37484 RepID=A0ABV5S9S9_9ACTN
MRQEVGYKEKSGQFTKFGQWYADRVQDTQYRDAPWCDMFIAWAADKAGISQYVGQFAWTPSHAAWFMRQGAWTQKPEPGALVFFDWRGGKSYKGIDHVGIVESVKGSKIHTIEANVDGVWLKRKTRETDKVVGYGVPRLVKATADKPAEIRLSERPFVPAPRSEPGSPLDFLGTPPALLTAMVLMTVVLSLRFSGRRRGTHRRFSWPWNAPTHPHASAAPPSVKAFPVAKAPPAENARAKTPPAESARAKPRPAPTPAPRPARTRVPVGSTTTATRRPTPTRRKPYDPS